MKNKKTKGFTLVELLVVIAIIAILATVSIVGYLSFAKKARVSNDIGLVTQLNNILVANEAIDGKNKTMHDAVLDVRENGFEVKNMSPTTDGYDIVWSQVDDRFVLMNGNETVFSYDDKEYTVDYRLWKAYKKFPLLENQTYSMYVQQDEGYLVGEDDGKHIYIDVKVGFDTGDFFYSPGSKSKYTVNYYGEGGIDGVKPIIRTNNYNKVEIDNPNADINYYGHCTQFVVTNSAMNSVHVFGDIAELTITNGRTVIENKATVKFADVEGGTTVLNANSKVENLNVLNSAAQVEIVNKDAEPEHINFLDTANVTVNQIKLNGKAVDENNKLSKQPVTVTDDQMSGNKKFAGGLGTPESPYIIETEEQLGELSGYFSPDGDFKLANDIILTKLPKYGSGLLPFVKLSGNKVIDLNGHTIKLSDAVKEKAKTNNNKYCIMTVDGVVTLKGNGTIDASIDNKTIYGITVYGSGAVLNIENGTVIGSGTAVQVQQGTLNIKDGVFKLSEEAKAGGANPKYIVNCIDNDFISGKANVNITGGTFGFDPNSKIEQTEKTYVAAGHHSVSNPDGTYTVVAD